jgi:CheY-like chemotaxis protein
MMPDALAGTRLLVVEDDPLVRDVIKRAAHGWGMQVDAADGGAAGIALLADNRYDVVITDVKMPGVSGLEVMQQVRELSPHTGLVVITGFASDELDERVARARGLLLHKPFDIERLYDTLQRAQRLVDPQ